MFGFISKRYSNELKTVKKIYINYTLIKKYFHYLFLFIRTSTNFELIYKKKSNQSGDVSLRAAAYDVIVSLLGVVLVAVVENFLGHGLVWLVVEVDAASHRQAPRVSHVTVAWIFERFDLSRVFTEQADWKLRMFKDYKCMMLFGEKYKHFF